MADTKDTMGIMQERDVPQQTPPPDDLLERLIRKAQEEDDKPLADTSQDTPAIPPTPPNGNAWGGLLSNPAVLQMLPQLLGSIGPLLQGAGKTSGERSAPQKATSAYPLTVIPHFCALSSHILARKGNKR